MDKKWIDHFDRLLTVWMTRHAHRLLRWALAVIFIWFGALKVAGLSPAAGLIARTVTFFPQEVFIPILGWWEVLIGLCFLYRPLVRAGIFLMFVQMPGTLLPLVVVPQDCFRNFPFALTLEGQYIVKNLALISAALVIGGTVREQSSASRRL